MSSDKDRKNKGARFSWAAVGAVILILLLLVWFIIVDSDGDPDNGFITPLVSLF